jgi:hypothetical protein
MAGPACIEFAITAGHGRTDGVKLGLALRQIKPPDFSGLVRNFRRQIVPPEKHHRGRVLVFVHFPPHSDGSRRLHFAHSLQHAETDLGMMPGATVGNMATSINNSGQIVGVSIFPILYNKYPLHPTTHVGFIYRNGALVDLNTLIPANSGFLIRLFLDLRMSVRPIPSYEFLKERRTILPLLGERAGARADVILAFINQLPFPPARATRISSSVGVRSSTTRAPIKAAAVSSSRCEPPNNTRPSEP